MASVVLELPSDQGQAIYQWWLVLLKLADAPLTDEILGYLKNLELNSGTTNAELVKIEGNTLAAANTLDAIKAQGEVMIGLLEEIRDNTNRIP